jgi:hypothetical protein
MKPPLSVKGRLTTKIYELSNHSTGISLFTFLLPITA